MAAPSFRAAGVDQGQRFAVLPQVGLAQAELEHVQQAGAQFGDLRTETLGLQQ